MEANWQVFGSHGTHLNILPIPTQTSINNISFSGRKELRSRGIMRQHNTPFWGSRDLFFCFMPSGIYYRALKTGLYITYINFSNALIQKSTRANILSQILSTFLC